MRQLLEVQVRFLIDLEVERICFIDEWADIVDNLQIDGRRALGRSQIAAQVGACVAAECTAHVIVEARVIDAEPYRRHARHAAVTVMPQAIQRFSIHRREFLEYDQLGIPKSRFVNERYREKPRDHSARGFIGGVELPFARRAAQHERAHPHEAGPQSANKPYQRLDAAAEALRDIEMNDKKGLNGARDARAVLDD